MGTLSSRDRVATFGDATITGLAAAGTTQATATTATADHVIVTTASAGATGILLRPSAALDLASVANHTAIAILVYPPTGAAFNGATANLAVTVPANHAALFLFLSDTIITVIVW